MSEPPYLGDEPEERPRSGLKADPLAIQPRKDPGPGRARETITALRGRLVGDAPILILVALAAAWASFQAVTTHPPRPSASAAPPDVRRLREVKVDVAALSQARGAPLTWNELFDVFGLEQTLRRRTLDLESNAVGGHAPDPAKPIAASTVTVSLTGG